MVVNASPNGREEGADMRKQIRTIKALQKLKLLLPAVSMAISPMLAHADDPITILSNQPYALCAGAIAFVFDQVAYANCQILFGTSISSTLSYPPVPLTSQPGGNIETVNQHGIAWGSFIVSTYSPPVSLTSPQGNTAIYTCRGGSTGSYAQCDGGICFNSTTGTTFPGLGAIARGQIVCSCPITTAGHIGYQLFGPYPCLSGRDYDRLCNAAVRNGSTLYIGAPIGTPQLLAQKLNGGNPVTFNVCLMR
jgi:hypothetical protein